MTAAAVAEVGSGSVGRQFVADHLSIHFHPFSVGFAAVVADTTRTNRPTYFFPLHPCKTLTIICSCSTHHHCLCRTYKCFCSFFWLFCVTTVETLVLLINLFSNTSIFRAKLYSASTLLKTTINDKTFFRATCRMHQ